MVAQLGTVSVKLHKDTVALLKEQGKFGMTYDDVVTSLLKGANKKEIEK